MRSDRRESSKKAILRNKSRSSRKKFNRRGSLDTAVTDRTRSSDYYELIPLPFSKDGMTQRHRESSQERLPTRTEFQRRHSPLPTAGMSQKRVMQLRSENQLQGQWPRRHSMDNEVRLESSRKPRRRATVASDPLPQQQQRNYTKSEVEKDHQKQHQYKGVRQDVSLGETVRSRSHVILEPISERSLQAVNLLRQHDFAFVKRSDGSYSYAILAYRSFEPIKGGANKNSVITEEECMTFVVNDIGNTKMICRRYWSEYVRLPYVARRPEIPHVILMPRD